MRNKPGHTFVKCVARAKKILLPIGREGQNSAIAD
jgi:hypothetical protein